MCVVAYTDSASIEGVEISFKHLVTDISENIKITVVGICQVFVDEIAHNRPQASRVVLPVKGMRSLATYLQTLHKLRPDVVQINICTPRQCATGLFAALTPNTRVVRVDQLPLSTTNPVKLWGRVLSLLC